MDGEAFFPLAVLASEPRSSRRQVADQLLPILMPLPPGPRAAIATLAARDSVRRAEIRNDQVAAETVAATLEALGPGLQGGVAQRFPALWQTLQRRQDVRQVFAGLQPGQLQLQLAGQPQVVGQQPQVLGQQPQAGGQPQVLGQQPQAGGQPQVLGQQPQAGAQPQGQAGAAWQGEQGAALSAGEPESQPAAEEEQSLERPPANKTSKRTPRKKS
jgi:hypothetical protein